MGFAQIEYKEIWVFVPKIYELNDLKGVISHEIGHIIEMKYSTTPENIEGNEELHELKADFYMDFYLLVDKVVTNVMCLISK